MATKSGAFSIPTTFQQVALCGAGAEVVVFGLVFVNTDTATRTVTLRVYRSAEGTTVDIPFDITSRGRVAWDKAIALQPADYVSVSADTAGKVTLVWSLDEDTGANPIASGFTPRGAYSSIATYAINHVVTDAGSSYISLVDGNTGNTPASNPTKWMVLASKGDTGAPGGVTSLLGLTGAITITQLLNAGIASKDFAAALAVAL